MRRYCCITFECWQIRPPCSSRRGRVASEQGKIGRMKLGSFDRLVRALDKSGVRYLVAGGLAVNAHGYLRFTRDVDLVLQLAPENIASAFGALEGIGYRPIVPVTAVDFADVARS